MEPTDKNSSGWNPKYVTGLFLTTIGGLWTFFDYTYSETINDLIIKFQHMKNQMNGSYLRLY